MHDEISVACALVKTPATTVISAAESIIPIIVTSVLVLFISRLLIVSFERVFIDYTSPTSLPSLTVSILSAAFAISRL